MGSFIRFILHLPIFQLVGFWLDEYSQNGCDGSQLPVQVRYIEHDLYFESPEHRQLFSIFEWDVV